MKIPIYQVDAFASELFKGNPAAVSIAIKGFYKLALLSGNKIYF
jgi:predicted PhzF superfamily epimerase YddE/YHI9